MIDIKVRYNTKCDDNHMFWRVLIDGFEYLASNVIFEIPAHTTRDIVYSICSICSIICVYIILYLYIIYIK